MEATNLEQAQAFFNQGIEHLKSKDLKSVAECFEKALTLNPNFAEVHNAIGLVQFGIEKYEGAIEMFEAAIVLNPNFAEAYNNRGLARLKICHKSEFPKIVEDYNQAITSLSFANALNPNLLEAYQTRADIYKNYIGDFDAAMQDYQKIISLEPNHVEPYINIAHIHFALGNLEESLGQLEQALLIDSDCPEAYCGRGTVRFHLGDKEGAKKDLFLAFDLYEAQGNIVYCVFTRSLIMNLFKDYEVYKDLFEIESRMREKK
ncbi:tetratricopeptide repeat protein [Anabaena azotica]|uniref:Tetratricopeptide repeat protein n=1 Tax=Anabaena azotica FACHB-119 TaxID=947527 RepID=A0ABR8DD57_9NOST|nr:tetratricopeptide repeat protein [Anabaena azotica]MBD2504574.1 tetratricopeptide repeat protein [Anabaena azotica FACHB-119]